MKTKLKIEHIEQQYVQADNDHQLAVTVMLDNGEDQETRILGFPTSITEDEMRAELTKFKDNWSAEKESSVIEKEREKAKEKTNKLIENMNGEEL